MKIKCTHGLTWHLREWMAHCKITSSAELSRALAAAGYPVTAAHAARLVKAPTLLSMPLLYALCQVLECTPGDLVRSPGQPAPIKIKPARTSIALPEPAPPRLSPAFRAHVVGPSLRGLQAHALARKPDTEEQS